jgi:hypothetical protein
VFAIRDGQRIHVSRFYFQPTHSREGVCNSQLQNAYLSWLSNDFLANLRKRAEKTSSYIAGNLSTDHKAVDDSISGFGKPTGESYLTLVCQ